VIEVLEPAVIVDFAAVKLVMPTAGPAVTVAVAVTLSPAAFVTVRVKVVLTFKVPVETATPLVTAPTPWSIVAAPRVKAAVSWLDAPAAIDAGLAVKLPMLAAGTTVTVTDRVTGPPGPAAVRT
jgi:hypothetical protein